MAATSFLDILRRSRGGDNYDGDEFGGASGADGSGLPDDGPGTFMFATGIECSYPTIGDGKIRRDLLDECGHYARWREDIGLVQELGLKVLRYGLPYHRVHLGPGRYDWEFADQALGEIRRLGITPILDLLHFDVPDWLGNFQNPELPKHFADYAAAVADRFPWIRYYTPVNEIYVAARISAKDGVWNEQLKTDAAFVTAIKHLTAASILATHAIAKRRPDAIIVQSESAEFTHQATATTSPEIDLRNKLRFLALDLLYAHPPDADVMLHLLDNGMTRAEYDWFMRGEPPGYQVMGNDYYGRNERIILADGRTCEAEDVLGWHLITKIYADRYRKPVMHTETNVFDADKAPVWLWKQWIKVLKMRADGVPVLGFTWYSLIDQVDWDIQLAEKLGRVNACGLYDLDRRPRPVAAAYRSLIEEFGRITVVPHGELFAVTADPARLKVEV
ncbi:MAG: family 1 glycosylhydrolase [Thermomicrobiales bacterium]